ncbi:MAG: hypothetical protein RLZZ468_1447 [Cyanobacteriota bacterium]|jgi:hypothetical protein
MAATPSRAQLIERFLELRAPPPQGFDGFSTAEIAGFIESLAAARRRLGPETWAALTGRKPAGTSPGFLMASAGG